MQGPRSFHPAYARWWTTAPNGPVTLRMFSGAPRSGGGSLSQKLWTALGMASVAWGVPRGLLTAAARLGDGVEALLSRRVPLDSEALGRLLGSACYSPARIERELGWRARVGLAEGLREMLGGG